MDPADAITVTTLSGWERDQIRGTRQHGPDVVETAPVIIAHPAMIRKKRRAVVRYWPQDSMPRR